MFEHKQPQESIDKQLFEKLLLFHVHGLTHGTSNELTIKQERQQQQKKIRIIFRKTAEKLCCVHVSSRVFLYIYFLLYIDKDVPYTNNCHCIALLLSQCLSGT